MMRSVWRRCFVVLAFAATLAISVSFGVPAASGDAYQATLEYTIDAGAYNNSVRAANITTMLYPRVVVDRNATSPFAGTIYVLGLWPVGNESCFNPVVVRSSDGGQSFDTPLASSLCLPGLTLDPVVARNGTLYAAAWGPRIIRSVDGGRSWDLLATLGNAGSPASLALDAVTGGLFVAWTNASWTFPGNVSVSSSWDGGLTWLSPANPLPDGIEGISPQLAVFGPSVLLGLIASNDTGPFVATVASQDGGMTWSNPLALTPSAYCMRFSAPSTAVSPGGIFAVSWYANPATTGPGCWDTWGNTTETFVAVSSDGGKTFSAPRHAGGPPGFPTVSFGDALVFDDVSRLYVTWHSISSNWSTASIYVANSTNLGANFSEASFTTRLQVSGGNSTAQENLATGPNGTAYLVWEAFDPAGGLEGSASGIFLRAIAGEVEGNVELDVAGTMGPVDVALRDPTTGGVRGRVRWTSGTVELGNMPPAVYDVAVEIGNASVDAGHLLVTTWGRTSFTLRISSGPPPPPGGAPFPWDWVSVAAGGVVAASAALASLHSLRLTREAVLQRKVRLLMFEYIRDHPGASFSAVRDGLGLQNGVAAYHLRVLEKLGLVHSESRRRHRWYYPNGDVSLWRDLPLSPLQASIVDEVRRTPGIGVRELARAMNRRASSVGYNVKALVTEGVLRTERSGRRLRCFPTLEADAS